jgi:hypothetical protein
MSVTTTLKFFISSDSYEEFVEIAESRISEFFNVELDNVRRKFSYEIDVAEDLDSVGDSMYNAVVIVRGRDV